MPPKPEASVVAVAAIEAKLWQSCIVAVLYCDSARAVGAPEPQRVGTVCEWQQASAQPTVENHKINIDKDSGALRRAFDAMHPQYVERLRREFPSLTDTDIVFCMLICLRYGTGEIADGLNISRASVNSARYRIRTKLNLSKEDNLDRYLHDRIAVS